MLNDREERISDVLESRYGEKAARTFTGGIEVLCSASKDKMAQSAHSLREVLKMIVNDGIPHEKARQERGNDGKTTRFARDLDAVMIPGRRKLPGDALYRKILKNRDKLLGIAHHGTPPTDHEYRAIVDEFEVLLEDFLKPHFEALETLKALIKIQDPTDTDAEKLTVLVSKNDSLYDYFFQKADLNWFACLSKRNYFSRPHPPGTPPDRAIPADRAQAAYLARHAKRMPEHAAELLAGILESEGATQDPLAQMHAVHAALDMPPRQTSRIARVLLPKRTGHPLRYSVAIDEVAELAARLAESGYVEDGIRLAGTLLSVEGGEKQPSARAAGDDAAPAKGNAEPVIGRHFFSRIVGNTVPRLFAAAPARTMDMLARCLAKTIMLENEAFHGVDPDGDLSIYWRPAMEDHPKNPAPDFKSDLVGKMAELLVEAGRRSVPELEDSLAPLAAKRYPAFRRLELHAYRNFPDAFADKISVAVGACFGRPGLRHEYLSLLGSCFSRLPEAIRKRYLERVIAGPDDGFMERAREFERRGGRPAVEGAVRQWKAGRLAPIMDYLTEAERALLGELAAEKSQAEPDLAARHAPSRAGAGGARLEAGMDPGAAIKAVRSYTGRTSVLGSDGGTPGRFEECCSSDSEGYSARAAGMASLHPHMRTAFLRGMKAASGKGSGICWDGVLGLCRAAVESIMRGDAAMGDEAQTLDAAADLLKSALRADRVEYSQRGAVWELLEGMASLGEVEDGAPPGAGISPAGEDAMTVALNTLGGMTFLAMEEYALWHSKHAGEKPSLAPEVRQLLTEYLDGRIPNSIPKHAAVGHMLPLLYWYDREWIGGRVRAMFGRGTGALVRAAWSGYLAHGPDRNSFEDMVRMYRAEVSSPAAAAGRAGPVNYGEDLVDHVTQGHLLGMGDVGDVFDTMLEKSDKSARSHCAWTVYRILKAHSEDPYETFNLEGFRKLWKGNQLGPHEYLGLWVECSPLGPKETLELLHGTLKSGGGGATPMMLVRGLRRFAGEHPDMVLACLEDMVRDEALHEEIRLGRDYLPGVLRAIHRGSSDRERTAALVNRLGEMGYNECGGILGGGA